MAESIVQVAPDSTGKKLHTWSRTIGANTIEDEFTLPGEFPYPSYIISPAAPASAATAGDDIFQLMAGASNILRIRRIRIEQSALMTTAASSGFSLLRVTAAGTGGTAVTPSKMSNADSAAGATAATGVPNATHGTAGAQLWNRTLYPIQTAPAGGTLTPYFEWIQQPGMEPIIIPAGTTNGIVMRNLNARAALTINYEVEFVETAFV